MEAKKSFITISGSYQQVKSQHRALARENKHVDSVEYFSVNYPDYVVEVFEITPYTPEEQQERMIYGDPEFEGYLMSEQYDADVKSEQWDWLQNEMS